MNASKKYQKIMSLAMGALLLSAPLAQSSMPVFAADTTDPSTATDAGYTADQLKQFIQAEQAKVAGATDPTPELQNGQGKLPSLQGLINAIATAQKTDFSNNAEIQTNYQVLSVADNNFNVFYDIDLGIYQKTTAMMDAYKNLSNQPHTGTLDDVQSTVMQSFDEALNRDYLSEPNVNGSLTFHQEMQGPDGSDEVGGVQAEINTMTPILQSDTALQNAITAGQKAIDSGQYTKDQLATLQKAMDDAKTNVTGKTWAPEDIASNYQTTADAATKAINDAVAALPKITPTKPSTPAVTRPTQPIESFSPTYLALQGYVAQIGPKVPTNAPAKLQTALTAAQTALTKQGTGYSDNDLKLLNYALNKAYSQYLHTTSTPLNGVGQVYTKGKSVVLYDRPAGSPVLVDQNKDRTLADQSAWKIFDLANLSDGSTWYNLGKNQWVNANYILLEKHQTVTVTLQKGAKLWHLNQGKFIDAQRQLAKGSDWRSFGSMLVDGQTYYNLGANQWVNAKDVTVDK